MDELKFQKLVIDTLCDEGNFATKLSHRFNVGVSDLLIRIGDKLVLCECKKVTTALPHNTDLRLVIGITPKQQKFLRDFRVGFIMVYTESNDGDKIRVTLIPSGFNCVIRSPYELEFVPRRNAFVSNLSNFIEGFCNDHRIF